MKSGTGGANWSELMSVMSRLCVAELNYFSLSFMERATTFRLVRREVSKCLHIWEFVNFNESQLNRKYLYGVVYIHLCRCVSKF